MNIAGLFSYQKFWREFWREDEGPTVVVWVLFIGIGAGAVVEQDGQVEGLGGLVQVEEKR